MRFAARLPLALPAADWTAGVALARVDMVSVAWLPWFVALAALLWLARRGRAFVAWLLAGIVWGGASLLWDARLAEVDASWLAGDAHARARVVAVRHGPGHARLWLEDVRRLPSSGGAGGRLAGSAWLYVHGGAARNFHPGDVIETVARWRRPYNRRNPGGFDFQAWCFDRHVALIGSARGEVRLIRRAPGWLQGARERIRRALAGLPPEEGGVLAALTLADRARVSPDVGALFAATGTMHLLAISGLHAGMAAGLGFALVWWLLTRREAWIVAVPVRGAAMMAGLALAAIYATLAGWPLPARRALMMLAGGVAAWWMRGSAPPLNTLLAALMLILLLDAAAVGSLSLWLSFLATAAILTWTLPVQTEEGGRRMSPAGGVRRWLSGLLGVTAVAGLATLPLTAHVFGRLPLYGLLANLVIVPLYGFFILPLALTGAAMAALGMVAAGGAAMALAGKGVDWTLAVLDWFSSLPGAVIWTPPAPLWLGLACLAGLAAAGGWALQGRRRLAGCAAAATLLVWGVVAAREHPPARALFAVWDVGQGASSALMLPDGHVLAVDAPGRRGSRFNGGVIAAEALRSLGLTHADALAVTHAQSDHMGGMASLLERLNHVGELWLPDAPRARRHAGALAALARKRGATVRWLARGDVLTLGTATARVLWPPRGFDSANPNDASLVLSLALPGGGRLLLSGDIEARVERVLAHGGLERHDVALMPHHGSATSSTRALVRGVRPALVIAQTGRGNRYGFPRPDVVRRWMDAGAAVADTATGAVLVDVSGARPVWRYAPPVRSERRAWAMRLMARW